MRFGIRLFYSILIIILCSSQWKCLFLTSADGRQGHPSRAGGIGGCTFQAHVCQQCKLCGGSPNRHYDNATRDALQSDLYISYQGALCAARYVAVNARQRSFTQQWTWIFRAVSNHTGTGALFLFYNGLPTSLSEP